MTFRSLSPLALALFLATGCGTTVNGGGDDGDDGDESGSGGAGGADASGEGGNEQHPNPITNPDGAGGEGGAAPRLCDQDPPAEFVDCTSREGAGGGGYELYCDELDGWSCEQGETPLVLSFDGADVAYARAELAGFDLTADGISMATDWPSSRNPWLALDRDGDGAITGGTELFGSAVRLASGRMASHGFEALAELDGNHDGRVDAADPRFGELRVWADANADRRTDGGELTFAAVGAHRIVSIDLAHHVRATCDARGNCGIERAAFVWADAAGAQHVGEVIDVHLPRRAR